MIMMEDTILTFSIDLGCSNTTLQSNTHTLCLVIKSSSCKVGAESVLLLALNDPGSLSGTTFLASRHQIYLNVAQWGRGGGTVCR